MIRRWAVFVLCFFCNMASASLSLHLESSQIQLGQTVRLTITNDDLSRPGVEPDLSPLQTDFNIVGTERSINYSVFNGQAKSMSQWRVLLMPKHGGVLTIPPIKVGQEQTQSAMLTVQADKVPVNLTQDKDKSLMLEASVSEKEPYVNQQVIYTVKFYYNQRLLGADFQAPSIRDGLMIPLADANRYQTLVNGVAYVVEEQHFAIFPQKSGPLHITPPSYAALINDMVPRKVTVAAKAIDLQVKAVPAGIQHNNWLPAKEVNLKESYDPAAVFFKQGDTLVRTITVRAVGAAGQLMPVLQFDKANGFSIYPEKPQEKTVLSQGDLVGTSVIKVSYLLNQSGKMVIPELTLPWFNTITGQSAVATLPSRTLQVQPMPGSAASPTVVSQTSHKTNVTSQEAHKNEPPTKPESQLLPWFLAGLFAMAWLITLLLWWSRPRRSDEAVNEKKIYRQLQQACLDNDAESTKTGLLTWARLQWPEATILSLTDVMNCVSDPAMKKELNDLIESLYDQGQKNWQGDALWRLIHLQRKISRKQIKNKANPLPPLNP